MAGLTISGKTLTSLKWVLRPPVIEVDRTTHYISNNKEYLKIVYKYVEVGENNPAIVDEVVKFVWLAGFSFTMGLGVRNWKSGVLVDLSDIIPVGSFGWRKEL